MTTKRVAVLLYGADRELWRGSKATLIVRDLNGKARTVLARKELTYPTIDLALEDLAFDSGQVYGLTLEASQHRPACQLIRRASFLKPDGDRIVERPDTIYRLMLLPRTPADLLPASRMAALNLEAKLRATYVGSQSVWSYVTEILHVKPDRVYCIVQPELKDAVERSAEFASAPGHSGYPDSWKHTRYEFGNLHLSFSANGCAVDADIDLARGLGHVGEWLDNNVLRKGQKTDQALVYALLFAQGILPAYTLSQLTKGTL